ncbi:MAG: glycosyltransferase family 4 protein, partial [Candidatus Pacebacteria bacterium]|nr:glycosyltransferase family 4 protein [Candidatus Paceibacterota bacterium]
LCAGLVQRGHQVTVLTGIPNYPDGRFYSGYDFFKNTRQNYYGAKVIRVPLIPRGRGGNLNLILNYLSFIIFGTLLAPFVCRQKYDAIFVYGISPILMALPAIFLRKIRKIPVVLYVLDLWPESISAVGAIKSSFFLNIVKKIVHFIYKHCDQILVSSPGFIGRIKEMGIDESKINYWPQWAEDNYKIVAVRENSAQSREMPSGFRIMFAGNIGAAQGFKTIVEAADKLKGHLNIQWVIIGDGRRKPWVEEQIRLRNLENTVHLLERRPVETMASYFALADVMLVSLKKDPIFALTLPAKIQSYMACGRPILACLDVEGAAVIKESGAGISCPAGDEELLAESVLKMSNLTEAERKEMGLRGRVYFEKHFSRDILLLQLEQLINGNS